MMLIDYWKPIKGYEGKYEVSYCGQVRSLDRYVEHSHCGKRIYKGRILKFFGNCYGYWLVKLCDGKEKTQKVHRLVAQAFHKNPNNYPQVHHIVEVKTINFACNLEWCNNQQNIIHSFENGRIAPKGEKHNRAKLTEKQVIEIKTKSSQGFKNVDLAKEYNVTDVTISDIKLGKSWKHLQDIV